MKLAVKINVSTSLRERIGSEIGTLECADYQNGGPFWLKSDSNIMRIIASIACKNLPIRILSVIPELSAKEIAQVKWFEPECRSIFPLSDREFEDLTDSVGKAKINSLKDGSRVRAIESLKIGCPREKLKYFSCPEAGAYIFFSNAGDFFDISQRVSGIFPIKAEGIEDKFFGLSSLTYLPASQWHVCSALIKDNGFKIIRNKVALVYESDILKNSPDVCLTSESYGDGIGRLVVSRKFVKNFRELGLKGMNFSPVFDKFSSLEENVEDLWKGLKGEAFNFE